MDNNKRIAKNTIFLYGRMLLILFISLISTRIVLKELGIEDYGIYNVVCGFVYMFNFLSTSLSNGIQRFYNYELAYKGKDAAIRVFNTALFIQVTLFLILLLLLETVGIWYINNKMVIPDQRLGAANYVFQFSILSLFFIILQVPFSSAIMAHEDMGYFAFVSMADSILKFLLILSLNFINGDKLIIYGLIITFISFLTFLLYFLFCKRKYDYLKINCRIDKNILPSMLSFSGWNIVETLAHTLKGSGINLLLNFFSGPVINAANGIAMQVGDYLKGFSQNIIVAFRPQLVQSYAVGNYKRVTSMLFIMSKFSYCVMLLIAIPIIIEVDYILNLWLGEDMVKVAPVFVSLCLVFSTIGSLNAPLSQVVHATGIMRNYQLCASIIIGLSIPISWVCLRVGFKPESVYYVLITLTVINQVTSTLLVRQVFPLKIRDYFNNVILPCFILTFLCPILPFIAHLIFPQSLLRLFVVCFLSISITLSLSYYLLLSKEERDIIGAYIISKFIKR